MQKKISLLTKVLIATSLSCSLGNAIAQETAPGFQQALEASGWAVTREADGSLILNAKETITDISEADAAKARWQKVQSQLTAAGWGVNRETDGSLILIPPAPTSSATKDIEKNDSVEDKIQTSNTKEEWSNIQSQLQATGWKVDREADGTLTLVPPTTQTETVNKAKPTINLSPQMQQQLKQAGWDVIINEDNSVSLYPPENSSPLQSLTLPQPTPGFAPTIELSLPVDSWQKAHDIAVSWLTKQTPYNASVGKIRKIFRIYIVSIVSNNAPHNLIQQIAIRENDGAVIVLN